MKTSKILVCAVITLGIASVAGAHQGLTPKQQLGKSIFNDKNLSLNRNQSCASCHAPKFGWTGPDSAVNARGSVYEGSIPGAFGDRKPPSSAYATQSPILHNIDDGLFVGGNFWDGRATGERLGNPAAEQAQGPFLNSAEQALPDSACVVYRVCSAKTYPVSLEKVFAKSCNIGFPVDTDTLCAEGKLVPMDVQNRNKSDKAYDYIAYSIAAFEASPESNAFTSKFDYWLKGKAKLTRQERRGFDLFQGKGQCSLCHISTGKQALFTDYTFDNLGIPKNPRNPVYMTKPDFIDMGLGGFLATRADYSQYAAENEGKHKVPTLRNVDKRTDKRFVKAYGHNGYFKSLKGIVNFYNTRDLKPVCPGDYTEAQALAAGCWPAPEVPQNVNTDELGNLGLTAAEEDAIVAFMKTLTDGYKPDDDDGNDD